jgi:hypothetical protein
MKKIFDTLKKFYQISKNWIVANGITGLGGVIVGLILWSFGYKIWAGFSFGIFATRNWDLFSNWLVKNVLKK